MERESPDFIEDDKQEAEYGKYVIIFIDREDKIWVIGEVLSVNNQQGTVTVHYMYTSRNSARDARDAKWEKTYEDPLATDGKHRVSSNPIPTKIYCTNTPSAHGCHHSQRSSAQEGLPGYENQAKDWICA